MMITISAEIPRISAIQARKFGSAHCVPLLFDIADKFALIAGNRYCRHFNGMTVSGPTFQRCISGLMESQKVEWSANWMVPFSVLIPTRKASVQHR